MNAGILFAFGAYLTWGIFPVYWKFLHGIPPLQLLSHRIIWSFLFLAVFLLSTGQLRGFLSGIKRHRVMVIYPIAAVLIGINWLTYVWAVNAGYIIETSLGYFINPLLNILLGVIVLRERLRRLQWLPVVLAAVGVIYLTFVYGRFPWIALTLAVSFGIYGLVKKVAPLGSLFGLTLETGILFLPALGVLIYAEITGKGSFLHGGTGPDLLMVGAGLVTTIPLLMFASAAQRIPLSLLGIIQYVAPTMQFLLGVLVYHESFDQEQLIGFCFVWCALVVFWVEGAWVHRRNRKTVAYK